MRAVRTAAGSGDGGASLLAAYDAFQEHVERHPHIDGTGIELAMEFELLAIERGADPSWDRPRLVRYERARKGGLATLARYGRAYYRALGRARWGRTPKGALPAIREALCKEAPTDDREERVA
jgi:hypothetical protein